MMTPHSSSWSWTATFMATLAVISTLLPTFAHAEDNKTYIQGTNAEGVTRLLANDRHPALYTGQFGDCLGGQSLMNVTGFDAAYYADNMTVLFHLTGTTNIRNESIMMYISVDAYGEDRFDMIFDPCSANIHSLCPMNASDPIKAEAIIPVSQSDVSGIPPIALVIPDFEGFAVVRLYSNSTQTEIGCFQAVMRNGASLSHPEAVAPVLGAFTLIAVLASFATAIYGVNIPAMRTHYAHSLSVLVIFETFQSFFFSGALSLHWPSVCAAWWSNFGWAAGMIHSTSMTNSINNFLHANQGNSSQVGGAGSVPINNNGGLQIYGREVSSTTTQAFDALEKGAKLASKIYARDGTDATDVNGEPGMGYNWYGGPVGQGLPLPGLWSNFTGELSELGIPASNAFMTGFLWFLILFAIVVGATVGFKWMLEGLSAVKWIKHDRLAFFRGHWLGFTRAVALRTMMIAFFMMMTLSLYQFSLGGAAGIIAVAAVVFAIFFAGLFGLAVYACFYRLRFGSYESAPDRVIISHRKIWKIFPGFGFTRQSKVKDGNGSDATTHAGSFPLFGIRYAHVDPEKPGVHEDSAFIKRFGWLSARYRRTRWWFFTVWLVYQFVRACFVGGARKSPEIQVYGLFVVEVIAAVFIVSMNPFEGSRNTALAVYLLSISKVVTAGLSIAFLPRFNMARIPTTVVGFVIVITQGFLTIAVLILIVLGAISSYMSLTRNHEEFRPRKLENIRLKYFMHLESKAPDIPPEPVTTPQPEEPKEPYFSVNAVRRAPKIEDEDTVADMTNPMASYVNLPGRHSRAESTVSNVGGIPYGARVHRASWSSRDFVSWQPEDPHGAAPSRHDSGGWTNNSAHASMTMAPLIRPPPSLGGSRPATPNQEQQSQQQTTNQRYGSAH